LNLLKQADTADAPDLLSDRIAKRLRDEITGGNYAIGEVLPSEQVIAERLGVSRTILREALSRLKADGLVSSRPGRGLTVISNTPSAVLRLHEADTDNRSQVLAIVELRRGFEVEAARLAALRRTDADVKAMRAALADMEAANAQGEIEKGVDADLRFHGAIARATGNHNYQLFFTFLAELLHNGLKVSRRRSAKVVGRPLDAQREHQAIFKAIRDQDAERAVSAARRHIDNTETRLHDQFESRQD